MLSIDETIEKEKANAEKLRKIIETGYDGEISIESIFCDDTSAIKEAYERFENCAKRHEQLADWLEDYKRIKMLIPIEQALKNEYNKAIDDFAKWLESKKYLMKEIHEHYLCYTHYDEMQANDVIREYLAEQLKEGVNINE